MTATSERIELLLVEEATERLSPEKVAELEMLLIENKSVDRYAFERVATTVFLAATMVSPSVMPSELYARLIDDGERSLESAD